MKKLFLIIFLFSLGGKAQQLDTISSYRLLDTISSKYLKSDRALKIQLPRSYEIETKKKYPLIIVMDGDYLFDITSGSVDYLSYWGDIPENIVVGVNQFGSRFQDSSVLDEFNFTPISSTSNFYDFLVKEMLPYVSDKYRVSSFLIAVGHERTANFINFLVLKDKPLVRGAICVSPKFSGNMQGYIVDYFKKSKNRISYSISTSQKDFESIYQDVLSVSKSLDSIDNKYLNFKSIVLKDENHYVVPSITIPKSIKNIYSKYSDIDKIEYDSIISKLETSPIKYLTDKYDLIKDFYGIEKKISVNDFMAIEKYIETNEKYSLYNDLAKISGKFYSETILPSYYKARYLEESGKPEKAMLLYRSAYNMKEVQGLTKDYLLKLADQIQSDFNL